MQIAFLLLELIELIVLVMYKIKNYETHYEIIRLNEKGQ